MLRLRVPLRWVAVRRGGTTLPLERPDGSLIDFPHHGGFGGGEQVFDLLVGEHITEINGLYGRYVDSTNYRRRYLSGGGNGGGGGYLSGAAGVRDSWLPRSLRGVRRRDRGRSARYCIKLRFNRVCQEFCV
jgi:hypothetical protein